MLKNSIYRIVSRKFSSFPGGKKVYGSFSSFGSDSAFQVSPILPVFSESENGTYISVKRRGSLIFTWAKATSSGYNWNQKQHFSLSTGEISQLITSLDLGQKVILDREYSSDEEGTVQKKLSVYRMNESSNTSNVIFDLSSNTKESVMVSLSNAEYHSLKLLMEYSIPYLYGFNAILNGPTNMEPSTSSGYQKSSSFTPKRNSNVNDWPF